MRIEITLSAREEDYEWQIFPLDGRAMENLEIMRSRLPEGRNSEAFKSGMAQMRL
ncbi:hypothetical protein ACULTK_002363 [Yersinia enterocolitica]